MWRRAFLPFPALALLFALASLSFAAADRIRTEHVSLAAGDGSISLQGSLTGYEVVDYVVGAQANQTFLVSLDTPSSATYFNLMAPGTVETAFFIGSTQGLSYAGIVPETGEYRVRVYQMRSAARRSEVAPYSISITLTSGDFADGLAGGPDFWEVTGVSTSLNLRDTPSTSATALMQFANGTVLRNKGCRISEGRRWCRVEQAGAPEIAGWVAGDYLMENGYVEVETEDARVPGTEFSATGNIPCARTAGQPMADCKFGVVREGNGTGTVTIFWPDTGSRVIFFEDGVPVYYDESEADGGAKMTVKKEADLFTIRIGEQRFEIPDAVVLGG